MKHMSTLWLLSDLLSVLWMPANYCERPRGTTGWSSYSSSFCPSLSSPRSSVPPSISCVCPAVCLCLSVSLFFWPSLFSLYICVCVCVWCVWERESESAFMCVSYFPVGCLSYVDPDLLQSSCTNIYSLADRHTHTHTHTDTHTNLKRIRGNESSILVQLKHALSLAHTHTHTLLLVATRVDGSLILSRDDYPVV